MYHISHESLGKGSQGNPTSPSKAQYLPNRPYWVALALMAYMSVYMYMYMHVYSYIHLHIYIYI